MVYNNPTVKTVSAKKKIVSRFNSTPLPT